MNLLRPTAHLKLENLRMYINKSGDIVGIEHNWVKTFALLPHRTISNRWIWLKPLYIRRVWVYTGFVDEPQTQYGDLFDILEEQ